MQFNLLTMVDNCVQIRLSVNKAKVNLQKLFWRIDKAHTHQLICAKLYLYVAYVVTKYAGQEIMRSSYRVVAIQYISGVK